MRRTVRSARRSIAAPRCATPAGCAATCRPTARECSANSRPRTRSRSATRIATRASRSCAPGAPSFTSGDRHRRAAGIGDVSQKASQVAVEVRLLGELEVRHGGRVQQLPASKKTRALLGYLVATGRPHLRESLCGLLWDGPDDPRAELRWCLSKIRPLLDAGGGHLAADRERAGFVAGPVHVDTAGVRELAAAGVETAPIETLRAAAALFRGELLEGLDLPACFRYHEWCVGEREALRGVRTGILGQLVGRLSGAAGDLDEALRWARERVRFDPLTEAAHVDVVRILGRLGRTREALAQYDTCRRILESELGARTSPALEEARRELTARG